MNRNSGILLSVTSLPSKYGIGCFDQAAYDFVDWLEKAGQKYWQILPLGATDHKGACDSPYQAFSAFAGNPNFISLDALVPRKSTMNMEITIAAAVLMVRRPICILGIFFLMALHQPFYVL